MFPHLRAKLAVKGRDTYQLVFGIRKSDLLRARQSVGKDQWVEEQA
jgi:hypothetical protein